MKKLHKAIYPVLVLLLVALLLYSASDQRRAQAQEGDAAAKEDSEPTVDDLEKIMDEDRKPTADVDSKDDLQKDQSDLEKELKDDAPSEMSIKESKEAPQKNPESEKAEALLNEVVEKPADKKDAASAGKKTGWDFATTTEKNTILNLEFKTDGGKSRIVVSAKHPLKYHESRNPQVKQLVYVFENTEATPRVQRAYDTTEFASPVGLFTMLQMPKQDPPVTKLIVQLREDKAPSVIATENGLSIEFPTSDNKGEPKIVLTDGEKSAQEENIYSGAQTFSGKPIQLEIKNSDIQDVLRLIAKTSGYNIVVGDEVSGKVGTLSLKGVPWDQAFTLVLQSKKLGYVKQGNVIRVASLSALKSEKEESLANEQSKVRVEPLKTLLIPISYARANELAVQAKNFLTERGTVDVDTRTNTVIVKDIERVVSRVQKLFAALDTQPARVSISARFIEMSTNYSRAIGFNLLNMSQNFGGTSLAPSFNYNNTDPHFTAQLTAPQMANLTADFHLGEVDGKVHALANPSITVVANKQATINSSVSFFVVTGDAAVGGVVIPGVRQLTANLTLEVTPIVSGDGSIFMDCNIKNEVPRGVLPNLQIDSRHVQTQLLLEDGDTAILGGIFQDTVNTNREGVPLLMDIPILGYLFHSNSYQDTKNEIFVFITAKILNPEETFKRAL